MSNADAAFPQRLMSYMDFIGVVTACRSENILAALVLVLQLAAQDLIEDLRRFLEANWTDLVRYASGRTDIEYYEHELAVGHLNELLVEAVCRMKDIQLFIRHLGAPANTSRLFGEHGPLYEIVEVDGEWFNLGQPIVPWSESALVKVAQQQQSQYEIAQDLEAVDIAGSSQVRRSSRSGRKVIGSLTPKTLKKTSRIRHLKFEVISAPIPSHVRSILTSTRLAAKRLSDQARRTLLTRVRFNPVALVTDISPLADKVPNRIRLPDDTIRQDDGDALETVRAEETVEREQAAAVEDQEAVEVEGEPQENVAAEEDVAGEGNEEEGEEAENGGVEAEEIEAAVDGEEQEAVNGGAELEEVEAAADGEEVEAENGGVEVEEVEAAAEGVEEEQQGPASEVVEPQGPAFEIVGNTYVCRLPGCPAADRGFATLKGWKLHASHTRIHQQQGFCTSCSHFVVMPPQLEDHEKKIWLDSHRRERCKRASRAVLKARRLEKERLQALWRDASHVRLPDEEQVEARRGRKRAYATEDERRAGVCLAFIKHFKTTNPARLDEVAADFQLTIL